MISPSELGSATVKRTVLILLILMLLAPFLLQTHLGKKQISFYTSTDTKIVAQNETTPHYRIQLDQHGTCVGSSDGFNLTFIFCDPTQQQTFQLLEDGKLKFSSTGLCVSRGEDMTGPLKLRDCSVGTSFRFTNESYLQITENTGKRKYCISNSHSKAYRITLGKELVVLSKCMTTSSKMNLIEETAFITRRKALLRPLPENNSYCNFPACGINKRAPPVELLPSTEIERCHNLSECVTVVVKTTRRPYLVLRLVESIKHFTGYELPVIAIDDGLDPYSDDMMSQIASYSNLQYVIWDDEDLGIALGRTLGVKMVQTKYFLLCDDDLVFNKHTNIEVLAEILDTTDATLAGGRYENIGYFAGFFNFTSLSRHGNLTNFRTLQYFHGGCNKAKEPIVGFPACMRCDTTANFFMAKRADILEVGCWSEELKIQEHEDFFLKLKAAGKKVVWCPEVGLWNKKDGRINAKLTHYLAKRLYRVKRFRRVFANVWNFHIYELHKGKKVRLD